MFRFLNESEMREGLRKTCRFFFSWQIWVGGKSGISYLLFEIGRESSWDFIV